MNRLTTNRKLNPEIFKNIKDIPENKYFLKVPNGKTFDDTIELTADKLGQLEDIEQELGIDLITLFNAKKGFYGNLFQKYYLDADNYSIIKTIYKYENQIKIDFLNKKIEAYFEHEEYYMYFSFCEYGITWALTKEELENGND